ncbi:hypothetical protein GYMLUDRAFT_252706 [Collybiopsis luxurians FD-317 M1]|uniref:Uncharacterized protein n=1 Tax=Collybiopsis luxurians FD-317 M1 TaxID=944289 RepID=A0A0D0AKH4_9AGAR|nr:hypothetical protein GYMLUDRAFT_252706 [Collybiopsis luxurians FD-317 M1]
MRREYKNMYIEVQGPNTINIAGVWKWTVPTAKEHGTNASAKNINEVNSTNIEQGPAKAMPTGSPDPRSFKAATNFTVEEPKANTHRDTGDFPSQNAPSIPEVVHQEDAALYAKLKDLYDLRLPKETPQGPRDDGTPSQNQSTIQGGSTPSPNQSTIHCDKWTPSPQRPSYHRDNRNSMPSRNLSTSQGRRQTPSPQYLSNHHNNRVQVNLSSSSSSLSLSSFPQPPRLQRKRSRDARDDSDEGYSRPSQCRRL